MTKRSLMLSNWVLTGGVICSLLFFSCLNAYAGGDFHTSMGMLNESPYNSESNIVKFYLVNDNPTTDYLQSTVALMGPNYVWAVNVEERIGTWTVGDDTIAIISGEANSGTATHAGYYSVMNEDLYVDGLQQYNSSVMRPIPVPVAVVNGNNINLTWSTPVEDPGEQVKTNIIGYYLYRSTNPATGFTLVTPNIISQTSYTDTTAIGGVTYYYAIKIVCRGGVAGEYYSANSNAAMRCTIYNDRTSAGVIYGAEMSVQTKIYFYPLRYPNEHLISYAEDYGNGIFAWIVNWVGESSFSGPLFCNDEVVAVGLLTKNAGTINHKGFYAVSSDFLSGGSAMANHPDCNLREIPIPVVRRSTNANNLTWAVPVEDVMPTAKNIIGYNVYRSSTGIDNSFTKIASNLTSTSYSDINIVSGNDYYYAIEPIAKPCVAVVS